MNKHFTPARKLILGVHLGISRKSFNTTSEHVSLDETIRIAQLAEASSLDLLFRGDFIQFRKEALNPDRPHFALDPLVELAALAAVTKRIGLVATLSTTFNVPYILARQLQSLDNISGGRIGWNAVTSFDGEGHFGLDTIPDQSERYARAGEFLDILTELFSSWEPGSIYRDAAGQVRIDKTKIRGVDYKGDYLSSRGGLGIPRSRQGWPVQFQAGASSYGIDFAARHADGIYSAAPTAKHAETFYAAIHAAAAKAGRAERPPLILPGLVLTLGATEAEARDKYEAAKATINYQSGVKALEGQLDGIRLDDLDLDKPVPLERFATAGVSETRRISRPLLYRQLVEAGLTLRQILDIHSVGNSHHIFVGSNDQAADFIRDWWSARRADGFVVGFHADTRGFEQFLDHVLPRLEDVRGPVDPDATLRDRLGLSVPA